MPLIGDAKLALAALNEALGHLHRDGDLTAVDEAKRAKFTAFERLAREWSGWFQRSSSCVEGRNGQLELRHHSLHRLSKRKLEALTAIHNYWLKRGGTTAAERFFGKKPADLFAWLLERLPLPARPARQRSQVA